MIITIWRYWTQLLLFELLKVKLRHKIYRFKFLNAITTILDIYFFSFQRTAEWYQINARDDIVHCNLCQWQQRFQRILRQNMQIFIAQKRCEIAVSKIRFRNNADGYAFPHARDSEKKKFVFSLNRSEFLRTRNVAFLNKKMEEILNDVATMFIEDNKDNKGQ